MAQRILRPLSYGDILDEMFDLYKKHFKVFVGIAALLYIPIYVLVYALAGTSAAGISVFLVMPASYVVLAATTWAVSRCYLGEPITIKDAYKSVGSKWLGLLGTMLLAGVFVMLGLFALIVPGVILAFRYAFISEVYVLEGLTGKDCRARSAALAKGNANRIFVIGLLAGVLATVVAWVLELPFGAAVDAANGVAAAPHGVLYGLVQGVSATITGPISIIASILLYYDIRVRKEGFDIEMLATNMGATSPVANPSQTTPIR